MVVVDEAFKNAGKKVGLEIWRIKEFKVIPVPKTEYGFFYSGDSYIVLSTSSANESGTPPFSWNIHFWLGKHTTPDEYGTAAIKTVELDDSLGGLPVQYREVQEYESPLFVSYFKEGIKYMQGGHDSGFKKVSASQKWTPRLFHCKGKRVVRCKQVELSWKSLNLGDVFILDNKTDIYIWCPPHSGRLERTKGIEIGTSIRDQQWIGKSNIHVLDQDWNNHDSFWRFIGGKGGEIKSAEEGGVDLGHWVKQKQEQSLFTVTDRNGRIECYEVGRGDLHLDMLDSKDAYCLEAGGGLYVWVGKGCTMDERKQAMVITQQYLERYSGMPNWTPIVRVLESAEPTTFLQWFTPRKADKRKADVPVNRMFECSDESGRIMILEIANFGQKDMDGDDVLILDTRDTIYVWIGKTASEDEKKHGKEAAEDLVKRDTLPRPSGAKIVTIKQGEEPTEFTKHFKTWDKNFSHVPPTLEEIKKLAISTQK